MVVATAMVWCSASALGHFTSSSAGGLAAIYIPIAVLIGLMIRAPKYTREFAAAVVLGNVSMHLVTGGPLITTILFSVASIAEALLVAWLVSHFGATAFATTRDGVIFGLSAFAGATLAGTLGAGMAALTGTAGAVDKMATWVPADTLGILLITPLVVTATWQRTDLRRVPGFVGLLLLASALALLATAGPALSAWATFLSWYVMLLVLLLVGVRYGVTALGLVQAAPAVLVFIAVADRAEQEWLLRQVLAIILAWSLLVAVLAIRSELRSRWASEQLAEDLFEQAPSPTARVSLVCAGPVPVLNIVRANSAWRSFFGEVQCEELLAQIPTEDRGALLTALGENQRDAPPTEVRWQAAGGRVLAIKGCEIPSTSAPDQRDYVVSVEDLTAHRAREAQLRAAAFTDSLTGLANRRAVRKELSRRLHQHVPTAVLYLDLNGFKRINDTYGHAAGDEVLREAGRLLTAAFRPDDLVARIGGDEFLVLATMLHPTDLPALRSRAEQVLSQPVRIGQRRHQLGVSAGAVVAVAHQSPEEVIAAADAAMYARKGATRDTVEPASS